MPNQESFVPNSAPVEFFENIFSATIRMLSEFPLTKDAPTMKFVETDLEPFSVSFKAKNPFINPSAAVAQEVKQFGQSAERRSPGMNTIGMLLDRLSIMSIKYWNLINRHDNAEKASILKETQIMELVNALAEAIPGHSSMNNKLTIHNIDAQAVDFSAAIYGLVTTNLLLWESQEVLYNKDILALPEGELRDYIRFFSRGNLARNAYIEFSDGLYWAAIKGQQQ
jgi:hypothetical protein